MSDTNRHPCQALGLSSTPSSKLSKFPAGNVSTPIAATSSSSVLLSLPTSASAMSAPLTPRNFDSPRRVVRVEYDTPRFLPSPAYLGNSANRSARPRRNNPTPRRIISVAVDGGEEEFPGRAHLDIIRHILERGCVHILQEIFSFLDPTDLGSVQLVSSAWRRAYRCDVAACQRHRDYIQGMKLYVRTVGIENVSHMKEKKESTGLIQRTATRNVLVDVSNMSSQRREKKPTKPMMSTATAPARLGVTPRRPMSLAQESTKTLFAAMTPEDAAKKAKKISSAKKESRMRRLRC